jgi:putative FmdB family regulatory protein
MPTYDYVCQECGAKFERFQKMSDGMLRKCPECGRLKLKRLMGIGAGIIFKGSGFYETDYKRKSSGNGKPAKSTVSAGSSDSSDSSAKESAKPENTSTETKKAGD